MKTILTLTFVLFFGTMAMAQDTTTVTKVDTMQIGVVLLENAQDQNNESLTTKTEEVARIYKSKYSRVKKELVFSTKYSKAKLA